MKTTITLGIFFFVSITNIFSQINMTSDGRVGLGKDPASPYSLNIGYMNGSSPAAVKFNNQGTYSGLIIDNSAYYAMAIYPTENNKGYLGKSGYAFSDIWYYTPHQLCDSRQKENIRDIKDPLKIILHLKGIEYDLKKEYMYSPAITYDVKSKNKMEKDRKDRVGFLAQDVEKVLPQAVFHDDSTDIYSMDYSRIIPVLVEAIKEQNAKIVALENANIQYKNAELPANSTGATLGKNVPNPFNELTNIDYYLPSTVQTALFCIYDLQGKQIKSFKISARENGSVTINGSELLPGMYYYTLIADGLVVGTEKMILTD